MRRDLFPQPRPPVQSIGRGLRSITVSDELYRKLMRYTRVSEGDPRLASIVAERLLDDAIGERMPQAERLYAILRNQSKLG